MPNLRLSVQGQGSALLASPATPVTRSPIRVKIAGPSARFVPTAEVVYWWLPTALWKGARIGRSQQAHSTAPPDIPCMRSEAGSADQRTDEYRRKHAADRRCDTNHRGPVRVLLSDLWHRARPVELRGFRRVLLLPLLQHAAPRVEGRGSIPMMDGSTTDERW